MLQATSPATLRPKRCKECREPFKPIRMLQPTCGYACSVAYGERIAAKARVRREKEERVAVRARKEKLKTVRDWMKEAQVEFNKFIRARDRLAGYPCISSGRPLDWSGNAVDAGHFRSVGAAPQLRFDPDNCHAQSKHDNQWLSGNAVAYRARLVERIGLARVEALEANNAPHKWTIPELQAIKAEFRARSRAIEKQQEQS